MKLAFGAAMVLAVCCFTQVSAGQGTLGSPDFQPSAERPYGWRGDGSGCFPGATPPVHWGIMAACLKGLRAQATKPKDGETGRPIPDGVVREWLVLGPVAAADAAAVLKAQGEGKDAKTGLSPDENEKAGNASWRKAPADSSVLDLCAAIGDGKAKGDVAFAHAYLYSEAKATVRIVRRGSSEATKVFVNGVPAKQDCDLEKGWNRLLFEIPCDAPPGAGKTGNWYIASVIYGAPGGEFSSENVAWSTRLPGWSVAGPVIAGDRIFVPGEMRTLTCVDKNSGRILWVRTATLCDVSTEEERKAHPEIFKDVDPMVKRLAELDRLFAGAEPPSSKLITEKITLEAKVDKLMCGVDGVKYDVKTFQPGEPGFAPRTPVTDGRRVWVSYHPCLTACYDLDGNLKWTHNHDLSLAKNYEHGTPGSPVLIGGKLIIHTNRLEALDAETGKLAWESPVELISYLPHLTPAERVYATDKGYGYQSSLLGAKVDGEDLLVNGVEVVRVRDGKRLAYLGGGAIPTPVLHANTMYRLRGGAGDVRLDILRLPDKAAEPYQPEPARTVTADLSKFPRPPWEGVIASPLYHDGLVYLVNADGVLVVVDAAKGEVVYRKLLDVDNAQGGIARGVLGASPVLAGKYIYIFGNIGTCLVIEPGREFKPIAKNRVEHFCPGTEAEVPWQTLYSTDLEQTLGSPVFEGKRMYCRGLMNLYCIEEKGK